MVPNPLLCSNSHVRFLLIFILSAVWIPLASAFSFVHDDPAHCSNITFHWTGGTPPFRLLIISPMQPIRNISIPDSAFNDNQGSFTTQLLFAVHNRVMFTMSDATGITAGGLTKLLTVADSQNLGCNTTSPAPDFFFSLNKDLLECKPYEFSRYDNATQPLTIQYFIPDGEFFQITAPIGDTFSWRNNLTAGTEVIFGVKDARGRSGGTSEDKVVIASDDKTCLDDDGGGGGSTNNAGAMAGGIIGGILGVFILLTLLWWFCRRRRAKAREREKFSLEDDEQPGTTRHSQLQPTPYTVEPASPTGVGGDARDRTSRWTKAQSYPASEGTYTAMSTHHGHLASPSSPERSEFAHSHARSSNSGSSDVNGPVIMHTDIAEMGHMPLELPPQYAPNRAPIRIPGMEGEGRGHVIGSTVGSSTERRRKS
ncbi:hypothetical protein BJ165DRAFT_924503 [Panaeolus papilionaceus]|nr:hypothetical protein BJ165DRAFT_924503 [Panaeolus papilionaceus]